MILSHFSSIPIEKIYPVQQSTESLIRKPSGFWVSVDGEQDWPTWCASEQFINCEKQMHYRVMLSQEHNVLILKTIEEMHEFNNRFRRPVPEMPFGYISWDRVAENYAGIIIAPYQWDLRLEDDFSWYYGWDCASGCIWLPKAIRSIELSQKAKAA
jgi:hypothetical protein